jgi:hypothetical protein
LNANVTMPNEFQYLNGLSNIQQENLFELVGILLANNS